MSGVSEKKRIGITGTMGSGKSTLRALLGKWMPVNDCDGINAALLEKDAPGYVALAQAGLLETDDRGNLDKARLSEKMFTSPAVRQKVEQLLHPLIVVAMDEWMNEQPGICAVEVPLLFEASLQDHFDEIWCVTCDHEIALDRLENGRYISREEANRRLAAQFPAQQKIEGSDRVFYNNGTLSDLENQIVQTPEIQILQSCPQKGDEL